MPEYMGGCYYHDPQLRRLDYWYDKANFEKGLLPDGFIATCDGDLDRPVTKVRMLIERLNWLKENQDGK